MTEELKEKLQTMPEDELRKMINDENQYIPEVIDFVKQLLGEEVEENHSKTDRNINDTTISSEKTHRKISIGVICIICCVIVCIFTIITSVYVVNQNNKKIAAENAVQRINELVEEIYTVDNISGNDYLFAKDKLVEIKTLIDENDIEGLPLSKYNAVNTYIEDLKTLDDLYNLDEKVNYDNELYVKEANMLIRQISNDKVLNKFSEGYLLNSFADSVKSVILGRAFFVAQNYFSENYSTGSFGSVIEFTPFSIVSSDYSVYKSNYTAVVSSYGLDRILSDEKDAANYNSLNTELYVSTIDKIKANGGYAIVVNYSETDGEYPDYLPLSAVFWYVGIDVSADFVDGNIKYNIKRYVDGEVKEYNGLSVDEALDFVMLNPA